MADDLWMRLQASSGDMLRHIEAQADWIKTLANSINKQAARIAELEEALNKINKKDSYPNGGFGPFAEIARAALEGKGNEHP
jgi:hypothetical protein